jgi:hypothetical protein
MTETPDASPPPDQPPPDQPPPAAPPPPPTQGAAYPVTVECRRQDEYNRFLPLVKWLLAFPHYIVLIFLYIGVLFAKIIAFFAVIFTRRYPEGIFNFVEGTFRWTFNVTAYVYLLTDDYPPFSLEPQADYPARLEIEYPSEGIDRWRPLVQWLLIIPYAFVAGVLVAVAGIVAFVGVFVILFTKELPEGMFKLILIPERWNYRANAYGLFMVDRYPPFAWEESTATRPAP